jgi:S1-C subfamily serine protease
MTEKQSLYALLGLSDKASPEAVHAAFLTLRQALDAEPESEEKHNRIAILQEARDVLLDRRRRAGYDRRQRDRREGERRQPAHSPAPARSPIGPLLAVLLIAAAAYPAWRYLAPDKPLAQPAALSSAPPAQAPAEDRDTETISADIAALLPPPAPAAQAAVIATAPAAPPAPQATQAPPPLFADSVHAATLEKFSASAYLIIGGASLGSGVALENDKLLTNCHVIAPNVLKGPLYAINPATRQKTLIVAAAFLITEDACVVHAPGLNGKPIAMGNAAQLARGAPIYNIGFAQGRLIASGGNLLGVINRHGQTYLVSSNYCDHGVSGGPLVDAEGRLVGLTSGGPKDRSFCLSLTAETARRVLDQTLIAIDAFPPNYLSNLARRW